LHRKNSTPDLDITEELGAKSYEMLQISEDYKQVTRYRKHDHFLELFVRFYIVTNYLLYVIFKKTFLYFLL